MGVTIVGAGAIGGLMGAAMIKAGIDVLFVDNDQARVDGLNQKGLTVHTPGGDWRVAAKAVNPSQLSGPLGIVYLATKSQHTVNAMGVIKPLLEDDSVVVSLQNGFNEEVIREMIGANRTIGAFVNYGGASLEPGELEGSGEAPLYLGELDGSVTARLRLIHAQCSNLCPTYITNNIWGYLWSKEANACAIAFTALADATSAEAHAPVENQRVCSALIGEGLDVAEVAGVKVENYAGFDPLMFRPKTTAETAALLATWQANNKRQAVIAAHRQNRTDYQKKKKASGFWWDLNYRKRKTEADWLVGAVVKKGEQLGVDVSLNKALIKMVNEIEDGKRPVSEKNWTEMHSIMSELGKDLP